MLYAPEALAIDLDRRRFVTRLVPGAPGTWWEQVRVPPVAAADHLDVFFAPAYTAPLRLNVPTVVTVHDLSYVAHPEWFRLREGARRRWITRRSVQRAAQVITVSEFSRDEIVEHFSLPAGRVRVIVSGIDPPVVTAAAYAGAARPVRRIHFQPPPRARAHSRVRGAPPAPPRRSAGHRRRQPHTSA